MKKSNSTVAIYSTGNDGLSSRIIKSTIMKITDPLTLIVNKSLNTGQFPDLLKIAKVVPIHKSNEKKSLDQIF